jgi:hypothetical protein
LRNHYSGGGAKACRVEGVVCWKEVIRAQRPFRKLSARGRVNTNIFPPCGFVAAAMGVAMMPRHSGTVNSSLTLRPSARCCATRRAGRLTADTTRLP